MDYLVDWYKSVFKYFFHLTGALLWLLLSLGGFCISCLFDDLSNILVGCLHGIEDLKDSLFQLLISSEYD